MKRCSGCSKPVPSIGLVTCQSIRCVDQGPAFCKECVVTEGNGILSTIQCKPCHEREQKHKKKLQRAMKNPRRKKSSDQNELQILRKHFNVSQETMAAYLGIGHRQYQSWERDFSGMQPSSRVQIYLLCQKFAPEFTVDWWEEGFERFLMQPVCPEGKEILMAMEPDTEYMKEAIIMALPNWTRIHSRAFNQLERAGLIEPNANNEYTRNVKKTEAWYNLHVEGQS